MAKNDMNLTAKSTVLPGIFSMALLAFAPVQAEPFSIEPVTFYPSGASSGGAYSLAGTMGQPDAGNLAADGFNLAGGFWAMVDSPDTSVLHALREGDHGVVITWPASLNGVELQQNSVLSTNNWSTFPGPVETTNGENRAILSPALGNRFFRLAPKP
jgi:hypothetical protein